MPSRARKIGAAAVVLLTFAMIAISVGDAAPWWIEREGGVEDLDDLVASMFEVDATNLIAFEALGVLLTAAMIGAMIIARPMHGRLDSENYPVVLDSELEATQHISDVEERS